MTPSGPQSASSGPQRVDLVVIGGSAGALEALTAFLPALPLDWPVPVAVVVHLPRNGPSSLPAVLGAQCGLPVRQAEDKLPMAPGTIHVAPPGYHLLVDAGPSFALSVDEPVQSSMPSIDVLFESAAVIFGPRVAGIVLSGANEDGADGLAAIRAAGGVAAVQTPQEATVATMPDAALRRCPDAAVIPAAAMTRFLCSLVTEEDG